jgi:small GTP-binding protein
VDTDDERETGLQLKDNPLEKPPLEITRKGKKAIEAYYRSLEGQKHSLNEVKILLVGDGGAGKTSLVKRLLEKRFNKKEPQTHGINIDTWKIKVKKSQIIVRIWDFGGQEIMHATHQFFLSKRSLYILVLDGRKDEKTEYWLRHIESFGGDSPALVVINKIDENPGFDVNRPFLQQKYKNIKGFYRVSCADKMGIAEFSKALGDALSQVEMLRTTWSISWFKVKMELEYMKEDYISYDQYDTICREHSVIGYDSQTTLVDFLNDLGIVLHFNDPYLKETSVINPRWITEAVYRIINSRELADNKGILNKDDLDGILDKQKYPVRKHDYIIELMKKFELCFSLDDCTVLIPDLLDVSEPRFDFDYDASLKFLIQYDFLPRSVIARFIVRMHKDIKGKFRWRTGVVLKNEAFQATAVIKADEREKKIYIYVSGEQKQYYFAVIRHTFRDINGSYEKLGVSERVPVPGDLKVTVGYDHLIKVKKSGENYFFPEGAEKKYNIDDLLSGFEEDKSSSIALNINRRKSILDNLDNLIFDNSTCEKEIHNILENNLWILGTEYSRISSNETLKKTVEGYLGKKFRKDSSKKRPDLLLAEDINRCYLLIELKRPNHSLNRDDETQALKYRDELNVELHNVKINIILMGGRIINNISSQNERPDVKYLSYKDVISNARNNLKWLISDLR